MNIKIDLVNRALYAAGLLNSNDINFLKISRDDKFDKDKKYTFDLCRSYFLTTYLELLSEVPWTSGRRRKRLLRRRRPYANTSYSFTYGLPQDCARPIELSGKAFYIIEGGYLCTNENNAELLYVSNGKIFPKNITKTAVSKPGAEDVSFVNYPGSPEEDDIAADEIISPGDIQEDSLENETPPADDDYPDYKALDMEPKFWELLEMSLAAKFAIKNTQQPRLHDTLMQKALLIKNDAIKSTKSIVTAKKDSNPWWADTLGLPKSHEY